MWWVNSGRTLGQRGRRCKIHQARGATSGPHDVCRADVAMHHAAAMHVGHRSGQLLRHTDQIVYRKWLDHLRQAFSATIRERDRPWIGRFIEQLGHAHRPAQPLEKSPAHVGVDADRPDPAALCEWPSSRETNTRVTRVRLLSCSVSTCIGGPRLRRCHAFAHRPPPRTANPSYLLNTD